MASYSFINPNKKSAINFSINNSTKKEAKYRARRNLSNYKNEYNKLFRLSNPKSFLKRRKPRISKKRRKNGITKKKNKGPGCILLKLVQIKDRLL